MGQLLSIPMVAGGAWLIWRAVKSEAPPATPVAAPVSDKSPAA
jgi:prolipoprotein diacylglyceryltransferase